MISKWLSMSFFFPLPVRSPFEKTHPAEWWGTELPGLWLTKECCWFFFDSHQLCCPAGLDGDFLFSSFKESTNRALGFFFMCIVNWERERDRKKMKKKEKRKGVCSEVKWCCLLAFLTDTVKPCHKWEKTFKVYCIRNCAQLNWNINVSQHFS